MKSGINLVIKKELDKTLWSLPPPSATRWLTSRNGKELDIYYLFEYSPQSWREWQRLASIKIQMKEKSKHIVFKEIDFTKRENELFKIINVTRLYTIAELGSYYTKFIKFHKPLYPSAKSEFMRNLTLYAQRLHYEDMLYFEALYAIALHFNDRLNLYSFRELSKKCKSIMMMNKSEWRKKLKPKELKKAHSDGANQTNTKRRELSNIKRDEALKLRSDGMILSDIAIELKVSIITVKRWKLPKVKK